MHFTSSRFCSLLILSALLLVEGGAQSRNLDQLREKEMINAKLREEDERARKQVEKSLETAGKDTRPNPLGTGTKLYLSEKSLPATEKKLLAADLELVQKFAAFLRQPETGLVKILNFNDTKALINNIKASSYPPIPGGGTYYSFVKRHNIADEWAQIRLRNGFLQPAYMEMQRTTVTSSGGIPHSFTFTSGYGWALLTELGEISLERVNAQHPAIQFLAQLQAPTQYEEFHQHLKRYEAGISADNSLYKTSLPAKLNTTYAMRSLNYKRADEIIVFQVIHADSEGHLHLLWKQIARFSPPELKGKPQK
jgi:hypothetical protein